MQAGSLPEEGIQAHAANMEKVKMKGARPPKT